MNEDHSLGPHIDYMVRSGMMTEDMGRNHPDRNALTSVLIGETIERIDCPDRPFRLRNGDILVVASDGIQFLSNGQITRCIEEQADKGSAAIAEALLEELREVDDPEQDNVCFSVIRVDMPTVNGEESNLFAPEFEPRKRGQRATTRPIGRRTRPSLKRWARRPRTVTRMATVMPMGMVMQMARRTAVPGERTPRRRPSPRTCRASPARTVTRHRFSCADAGLQRIATHEGQRCRRHGD